jgi:hypothetical protein
VSPRVPLAARGAALALAAALAACPLPQPLPEYPDAGTIPPPRIRMDAATPDATVLHVSTGCTPNPLYTLSASIVDDNTVEGVLARWFVDYDPTIATAYDPVLEVTIPPPEDGVSRVRAVPPWTVDAYQLVPAAPGDLHVVELVVSNGFAAEQSPPVTPRPYRTPAPNFETQAFRWVFHYVAPGTPGATCGFPPP